MLTFSSPYLSSDTYYVSLSFSTAIAISGSLRMRTFKIPTIFTSKSHPRLPYQNPIRQNLVDKPESQNGSNRVFRFLRGLMSGGKIDGGSRTEAEEKLYSWLYALAQSDKDLVFEYVRSTERGLSFTEAERRLKENGPNVPVDFSFPSWWHFLWSAFFHPFNIILIVLSVISYITSDSPNGCIMLVLVLISVCLRFYQEYGSSKAAMELSEFVRCPVKVQRCAGRVVQTELVVQIDQRDIVPGDIIIFEPGDLFPGDVRLLSSKHLVVSQASLTGESWTTEKTADIRENQSTPLLDLRNICFMGTNVVSGSGSGLVVSTGSKTYMSTMFSNIGKKKPPNEFEDGVRRISYVLVAVMLVVVTIIVITDYSTSLDLSESILFGVSVASALTPQMLPLVVNTSLAKGALAMARDRCIIKSLSAIRNMGSMDILCIDKTGTLTMNRAIMVNYLDSWGLDKEKVLQFAFLNSYFKTDQKYPLDDAILAHVYTNGFRFQPSKWKKLDEIPFDFIRRRVSIIMEREEDTDPHSFVRVMVTKGALEEVMKVCSCMENVDSGTISPLSPEQYQRIINMTEEISNEGLRVIGVATKKLGKQIRYERKDNDDTSESDMVFLGLITFFDPPKDSAKQALWQLAEKGVKAKVLTAHVGISVDSGASVAKDFADIILLEKDLNVLIAGVEHGRLTFGNTMKYIKMSVIANLGSVLSILIATLVLKYEPLTARQLLTQNFLYSVGQIAIPWDKMEDDYVKVPQRWSKKGLPTFILWNGPVCTLFDVTTLLFLWFYYKADNLEDLVFFHTAWFIEGLLMQTLIIHLIRTEKIPFIQEFASWPVLCSTVLVSAIGIAITFTPIGKVMGFIRLPLSYFGFLVVLFIGYFVVGQVVKRLYILVYKTWL
ncbi:magnesium-transporting ATPase, P-type 1 isoform X3 [Rosa chinensis]|uniref:magnesium-transporting ATPase, P-type 1 isoform X3 n=1 Tax=Rosa chinensis TaxID=74649 RepID=UPI000D093D5A|nr:magnesium-transporting ATPase, P-type 1 isoform X3 [Rosa chinensis]